jgi:hypothetical protein
LETIYFASALFAGHHEGFPFYPPPTSNAPPFLVTAVRAANDEDVPDERKLDAYRGKCSTGGSPLLSSPT